MSAKIFSRARESGFFRKWDILVYVAVALIAAVLLAVFLVPEREALDAFEVFYDNERVLRCDLGSGEIAVEENFADAVSVTEGEGGLTVTVSTERGTNVFYVDIGARSVKMTDADCSVSEDCTYMPALTDSGGSIVCVPNRIKILPADTAVQPPVTG